jgi:hypothetical protein
MPSYTYKLPVFLQTDTKMSLRERRQLAKRIIQDANRTIDLQPFVSAPLDGAFFFDYKERD